MPSFHAPRGRCDYCGYEVVKLATGWGHLPHIDPSFCPGVEHVKITCCEDHAEEEAIQNLVADIWDRDE